MRITSIAWQNFKGLDDGKIIADSENVIVRGQNGSGKSSLAEIVPFILFGKITGSIKRFENGLAPVGVDGITHAAEVTFDNGFTFRREIVGGEYGNKTNYFINGNSVKATEFKVAVDNLTNGGNELVLNPFAFPTLAADKQRAFLLKNFAGNLKLSDDDRKILDGLSPDVFIAKVKSDLVLPQKEVDNLPHQIEELQRQLANLPDDLNDQIDTLTAKIGRLQFERDNLQLSNQNPRADYDKAAAKLDSLQAQRESVKTQSDLFKSRREELLAEYHELKASQPGKCPTCGQNMPPELFQSKLDAKLEKICAEGQSVKNKFNAAQSKLALLNSEIAKAKKILDDLRSKADNFDKINESRRAELKQVNDRLAELYRQLAELKKATDIKARIDQLIAREKELNQQITTLKGQLQWAKNLRQRQIEDTEQIINSHFEHVSFKLFNFVISTGEYKPTCEPMLNGVPFSALSKGEKLKAALDIFKAIQNLYGVELPLIIDDAESYTLNSFLELPNQLWLFKVSDEPQLVIDVQKARRAA